MMSKRMAGTLLGAAVVVAVVGSLPAGVAHGALDSWMEDNYECLRERQLLNITFPGTHDSGAYNLTGDLVPGAMPDQLEAIVEAVEARPRPGNYTERSLQQAITLWSEAQRQTFLGQLQAGVRYLDVRSGWDEDNKEWRTFHMEFGAPIQDLLNDIAEFASEHAPYEVVLVEVSHFWGYPSDEDIADLADMIVDILGPWMMQDTISLTTTFGEIADQELGTLIVTFEDDDLAAASDLLWPASAIHNSYADSCDLDTMEAYNWDRVAEYTTDYYDAQVVDTLFKVSWTLTPDAECILQGINPANPWGLEELSATANGQPLDDFMADLSASMQVPGQIVIADFIDESNLVNELIGMNCPVDK